MTIAFVGLGNMGAPMAARLLGADHAVHGFDLDPAALRALAELGGTAADTLADAVRDASVVVLMLPGSSAVGATLHDEGFVAGPGTVVVDMSSSEPLRTRELAAELAARGVTLVDAPVSGGVARARTGTLTIMAGGEPADLDRVAPVLAPLGTVTRTGAVGSGHAVKALNNLLSATHLLVTSEAILAGERFGLDPETMVSIFNGSSGRSGSTENKWPNFILPGTYDSGFGLRLMLKDMRIATGLADQVGAPDPLGHAAVELWARAAEALEPNADHTEIVNWLRKDASA
ncbi:beta-hydroxyacid dehydrogenase, 3-hydroxyisobutyrate dehydrogenase [Cryptosporangium arvum DSM 44712]|uniref:Beta-hydroxyacid dehydrogenase, 3-hydroxyisobutyrate dehydrogenase n=2 Tax=Cryptosporangium TaxID=65502 RepID=A0A010Z2I2_9ACTN|nr:NAD(P)-dependent oxidoreductase [Cryptosporangium arvum]EXG81633.1 beta-hydroxyacid dehydrogenase, 3-hydroxyisobutyrate dehydrogenase [Cryptosporangium arvum DSM 44712]